MLRNSMSIIRYHLKKIAFEFRRRQWHPTPVLLPGKSHGWRSLEGCSSWGHKESDMTKWLYFHFSLSCIREGNGNPLQCSYLENPRDGEAWWAAVYGVSHRVRHDWSDLAAAAAAGHMCVFNFIKKCHSFPEWLNHLVFTPARYDSCI